jgi:hypothetical protein
MRRLLNFSFDVLKDFFVVEKRSRINLGLLHISMRENQISIIFLSILNQDFSNNILSEKKCFYYF